MDSEPEPGTGRADSGAESQGAAAGAAGAGAGVAGGGQRLGAGGVDAPGGGLAVASLEPGGGDAGRRTTVSKALWLSRPVAV